MRDREAFTAARGEASAHDFQGLRGHKYALLVTYRRSGEAVPTPVWFGLDGEGRLYVRSEASSGKVKRLRANNRVMVAPATSRGRPLGPLADGAARVLPQGAESERAERALRSNYGLGRRVYEGMSGPLGVDTVYLEVTPSSQEEAGR
jgi:PPOX class probable F420-dependent enzyme